MTLAEAQKTLPQAERATAAPTRAEAALVLVRAVRCMLRRATHELKNATPTPNARIQRREPQASVRWNELLGGGDNTDARQPDCARERWLKLLC